MSCTRYGLGGIEAARNVCHQDDFTTYGTGLYWEPPRGHGSKIDRYDPLETHPIRRNGSTLTKGSVFGWWRTIIAASVFVCRTPRCTL
jgi:hypothetical protein